MEALKDNILYYRLELAEDAMKYVEMLADLTDLDPESEAHSDLEADITVQISVLATHAKHLLEELDDIDDLNFDAEEESLEVESQAT